ncbi:hypothetical protein V4C53_36125 [Paraburkholderia azotifigens]|uniref:hypothetical protein n=1 Tax=Paraburkholderia azotifigens TaxID=2057004 RepID=UPI0031701996
MPASIGAAVDERRRTAAEAVASRAARIQDTGPLTISNSQLATGISMSTWSMVWIPTASIRAALIDRLSRRRRLPLPNDAARRSGSLLYPFFLK